MLLCRIRGHWIRRSQFNYSGSHARNLDATAWLESRVLKPASRQPNLRFDEALPKITTGLNLQHPNRRVLAPVMKRISTHTNAPVDEESA
jgi:hypothetical protein